MSDALPFSRRGFLAAGAAGFLGASAVSICSAEEPPRAPSVLETLSDEVAAAPLSMRFTGTTADDCRRWQAEFAKTLARLLGPHRPPRSWKTALLNKAEEKDHVREELLLSADGVPSLPVYVLTPRPAAGKRVAGVLALHGHGSHGHHPLVGRDDLAGVAEAIASANYDYGRQFVRRGYAVAAPCMTPFGVRLGKAEAFGKQDPCSDTFLRMQALGKLLIAENLRDCLWALELLAGRPEVDASRLACVGLSYGGRMTMLAAAVEPRIKAAVISGALNVMQERLSRPYSCGAQIIPGLLQYGDVPEIASLIAPRHCLWEVGSRDGLISPKWADEALARQRKAYAALAAEDRLKVDRFEGGHAWNGKVAYTLLEEALK